MINRLLYALINNKDHVVLARCSDKYFHEEDKKKIKFLKEYYAKYKDFPDKDDFETKFKIELESNTSSTEYFLDELKQKYKKSAKDDIIRMLAKAKVGDELKILQDGTLAMYDEEVDREISWYGEDIEKRREEYKKKKESEGITYISTGNDELDKFTYGIKDTDFWLLAGFEKVGKSFKVLRMAHKIAMCLHKYVEKRGVLFVSCEVNKDEFYDRIDSMGAKLPYGKLMGGTLDDSEEKLLERWYRVLEKLQKIEKYKLIIVDDVFTLEDLLMYIALLNPALVIVDSFHLLAKSYEWKDLIAFAGELKKIARMKKIPIIGTTHANLKEGDSLEELTSHTFSYFKGARDPDFAFIMYKDKQMEIQDEVGTVCVAARRGVPFVEVEKINWMDMSSRTIALMSKKEYLADTETDDDISPY